MRVLIVGGTFDEGFGKPSGYISKMVDALNSSISVYQVKNGGNIKELAILAAGAIYFDIIFWLCDVDNSYDKFLPDIKKNHPGVFLIQSKFNGGRYTDADLHNRMRASGADMLIEFNKREGNRITARLLHANGFNTPEYENVCHWTFLIKHIYHSHFKNGLITPGDIKMPRPDEPGSFGFIRKNHIHEGIDIYTENKSPIFALQSGKIVHIGKFTGEAVGSPWWNDTECIMIEGDAGVVNYGEIIVADGLKPGMTVLKGDLLGRIQQVLKVDKGLPMSMLHLELYKHGTTTPIKEWALNTPQPEQLLNPTSLLYGCGYVINHKDSK